MKLKLTFEVSDELLRALARLPRFQGASKGPTREALEAEILEVVQLHFVRESLTATPLEPGYLENLVRTK